MQADGVRARRVVHQAGAPDLPGGNVRDASSRIGGLPLLAALRPGRLRLGHGRRDPGGVRFPPHVFRVGQFVVFFEFHSTVLEPDFDLSFGED